MTEEDLGRSQRRRQKKVQARLGKIERERAKESRRAGRAHQKNALSARSEVVDILVKRRQSLVESIAGAVDTSQRTSLMGSLEALDNELTAFGYTPPDDSRVTPKRTRRSSRSRTEPTMADEASSTDDSVVVTRTTPVTPPAPTELPSSAPLVDTAAGDAIPTEVVDHSGPATDTEELRSAVRNERRQARRAVRKSRKAEKIKLKEERRERRRAIRLERQAQEELRRSARTQLQEQKREQRAAAITDRAAKRQEAIALREKLREETRAAKAEVRTRRAAIREETPEGAPSAVAATPAVVRNDTNMEAPAARDVHEPETMVTDVSEAGAQQADTVSSEQAVVDVPATARSESSSVAAGQDAPEPMVVDPLTRSATAADVAEQQVKDFGHALDEPSVRLPEGHPAAAPPSTEITADDLRRREQQARADRLAAEAELLATRRQLDIERRRVEAEREVVQETAQRAAAAEQQVKDLEHEQLVRQARAAAAVEARSARHDKRRAQIEGRLLGDKDAGMLAKLQERAQAAEARLEAMQQIIDAKATDIVFDESGTAIVKPATVPDDSATQPRNIRDTRQQKEEARKRAAEEKEEARKRAEEDKRRAAEEKEEARKRAEEDKRRAAEEKKEARKRAEEDKQRTKQARRSEKIEARQQSIEQRQARKQQKLDSRRRLDEAREIAKQSQLAEKADQMAQITERTDNAAAIRAARTEAARQSRRAAIATRVDAAARRTSAPNTEQPNQPEQPVDEVSLPPAADPRTHTHIAPVTPVEHGSDLPQVQRRELLDALVAGLSDASRETVARWLASLSDDVLARVTVDDVTRAAAILTQDQAAANTNDSLAHLEVEIRKHPLKIVFVSQEVNVEQDAVNADSAEDLAPRRRSRLRAREKSSRQDRRERRARRAVEKNQVKAERARVKAERRESLQAERARRRSEKIDEKVRRTMARAAGRTIGERIAERRLAAKAHRALRDEFREREQTRLRELREVERRLKDETRRSRTKRVKPERHKQERSEAKQTRGVERRTRKQEHQLDKRERKEARAAVKEAEAAKKNSERRANTAARAEAKEAKRLAKKMSDTEAAERKAELDGEVATLRRFSTQSKEHARSIRRLEREGARLTRLQEKARRRAERTDAKAQKAAERTRRQEEARKRVEARAAQSRERMLERESKKVDRRATRFAGADQGRSSTAPALPATLQRYDWNAESGLGGVTAGTDINPVDFDLPEGLPHRS